MRNSRAWKRSHTATFPDAVVMESEKRAAAAAILVDRFLPLGSPPPPPLSPSYGFGRTSVPRASFKRKAPKYLPRGMSVFSVI